MQNIYLSLLDASLGGIKPLAIKLNPSIFKPSSVEYFTGLENHLFGFSLGPDFDLIAGPVLDLIAGPVLDLIAGPDFDLIAGPVLDLIAGPVLDLIAGPDLGLIADFDVSGLDMANGFKVSFTILVKNTRQTKN